MILISESETSPAKSPPAKKKSYKLPEETKAVLDADTANEKLWSEVTTALQDYPVSIDAHVLTSIYALGLLFQRFQWPGLNDKNVQTIFLNEEQKQTTFLVI